MNEGAADAFYFIRCNRHADTSAADENTPIKFPVCHPFGSWKRVVRIINRCLTITARILIINANLLEQLADLTTISASDVVLTCFRLLTDGSINQSPTATTAVSFT